MLLLAVSSLAVLAVLVLAGLYWRWQLRGVLLGGVFLIAIIFAYASGLAFVYTDPDTLPRAASRLDFFLGAIIGGALFLVGALMSVLALETRRGPSRTIREIFGRAFESKPRRGAEWQVVDGVVRQTRPPDLGATEPGNVIIPKDYAVIFEESSGKFSRAEFGPTIVQARSNDKPTIVLATRPRFRRFSISNLMTADGLLIDQVDFSLLYHLEKDDNLSETANIRQPISEETLLKAVYGVAKWEEGKQSEAETWQTAVEETAKNIVRAEFAKTSIIRLFENEEPTPGQVKEEDQPAAMLVMQRDQPSATQMKQEKQPTAIQLLATSIIQSVNGYIGQWGAVVDTLQIDHIALPQNVQKRLEERWMSERMKAIRQAEGEAEGERIKKMEAAKGEAWAKLIDQMCQKLEGDRPLALKYISIFEYLDSLARAAKSATPTMGASIRDLLNLARDSDQKQGPGSGQKQSPDTETGPRDWFDDTKGPKKPTVIGDGPQENSPPEEKGKSGEAVS